MARRNRRHFPSRADLRAQRAATAAVSNPASDAIDATGQPGSPGQHLGEAGTQAGWGMLACPHCDRAQAVDRCGPRQLRCSHGHSFDTARQGYVSLLSGRGRHGLAADDADMVAARTRVQTAGVLDCVAEAVVAAAELVRPALPAGGLLDVGGGTGFYAARVLEAGGQPDPAGPASFGVSMDLSAYAARRAAKAHPALVSVVADVREPFPIRDQCAALVLVIFAPRNAEQIARVLTPGGAVIVVTPLPQHLTELRAAGLGMVGVDPRKDERLSQQFSQFTLESRERVQAQVSLWGQMAADVLAMGPSAHHVDPASSSEATLAGAAVSDLGQQVPVTLAVQVSTYRR